MKYVTIFILILLFQTSIMYGQIDESVKSFNLISYSDFTNQYYSKDVSDDGKVFIIGNPNTIWVYSSLNFKLLRTIDSQPGEQFDSYGISHTGSYVCVVSRHNSMVIKVVKVSTGELIYINDFAGYNVGYSFFSNDDKLFAAILHCKDLMCGIEIVDLESKSVVNIEHQYASGIEQVEFTNNNLYLIGGGLDKIFVWNVKSGSLQKTIANEDYTHYFALTNDNQIILGDKKNERAFVEKNLWTNTYNRHFLNGISENCDYGYVGNLILSNSGNYISFDVKPFCSKLLWDYKNNKYVTSFKGRNIRFSPDDRFVAFCGDASFANDSQLHIIETSTGNVVKSFRDVQGLESVLGWIDNLTIIASTNDNKIKTYSISKYITKPVAFPNLKIQDFKIVDPNQNGYIDNNETCKIGFKIFNYGKGPATNLILQYNDYNPNFQFSLALDDVQNVDIARSYDYIYTYKYDLNMNGFYLGDIPSGSYIDVEIPIISSDFLETDKEESIVLSFTEQFGFPPDSLVFKVKLSATKVPSLKIEDVLISTESGFIEKGKPVRIIFNLINSGQENAKDVVVKMNIPKENVFMIGDEAYNVDLIKFGEKKQIIFEIISNKLLTVTEIETNISVTEKYGSFGFNYPIKIIVGSQVVKE